MKYIKIIGFSIALLYLGSCAVMIALFILNVNRPTEIGEHIASVDWLPAEATNINYYRSYGFTAYEFKISEVGFRDWAASVVHEPLSEFVTYQPITEIADSNEKQLFTIQRYNSLIQSEKNRPANVDYSEDRQATSIEIENGLWGEMRRKSAGGYSIGFDRNTGTAYWQSNPR